MKRTIAIVGNKGNMASRYAAILRCAEGITVTGWDVGERPIEADGYIVCTPTPTHIAVIKSIAKFGKPILCEKPVTKSLAELAEIRAICEGHGAPFQCVMQYCWLAPCNDEIGPSHYDYFKHGPDGLIWDCFQIIALAKGDVEIGEQSPVWDCVINGRRLNIAQMDFAYIEMIRSWLYGNPQPWEFIEEAHRKVAAYEQEYLNRNPSA
jgi:hypothetical protein